MEKTDSFKTEIKTYNDSVECFRVATPVAYVWKVRIDGVEWVKGITESVMT